MTLQITVTRQAVASVAAPPAHVTTRLTLGRSETFRLPRGHRSLNVVAGTLWLTHRGRDLVRSVGPVTLPDDCDDALLSGLGNEPVVIEFSGADEIWWKQRKTRLWPFWPRRTGGRRGAATDLFA